MPSLGARIGFAALLVSVLAVLWLAQRSASELHRYRTDDPRVWEPAIEAFERAARESAPPADAVLFIGASTVRFWSTIGDDMAPLPTVARGFGGAKLADVLHYADRLVATRPGAIVLAVGGNDLFEIGGNEPSTPEQVFENAKQVLLRFRELAPGVPLYYLAIRPPILDARGRDPSSQANALIRGFVESTAGIGFIDANAALYGDDGRLRAEFISWDRSQLTPEGYRAWSAPIRDRLLQDRGSG